jgi:hypothetical protein
MGYKVLGYAVWNGGKWYLGRRYGHLVPSRKVALAGLAAIAVGGFAAVAVSRSAD